MVENAEGAGAVKLNVEDASDWRISDPKTRRIPALRDVIGS